jgi:cytidylate kinase
MAILTISREHGSGGREIGHAVAKIMGYAYVNKEDILSDIRRDGPQWERSVKDLDEHCPTVWEKYDWSFRGFAALIQKHILEHALNNNVIIIGRGGNFLLKNIPHAYRIRVVAPIEMRIERIVRRESVDRDTARWLCEKVDSERSCFLQTIYGKRWDETTEYDRVFQIQGHSVDDVVALVRDALIQKDHNITDAARNTLAMLALAAKIKAGIATDSHFFVPTLDVTYDGKEIVLRGVTHTPKEHKHIEEAAQQLAGGKQVRCELHYRK